MLQSDPKCFDGWYYRGLSYYYKDEPIKAVPDLRRAIELSPDLGFVWRNYGKALKASSQYVEAEEAFSKAAELAPDDGTAKRELARLLFSQKRFADARNFFQEASLIIKLTADDWMDYAFSCVVDCYSADALSALGQYFDEAGESEAKQDFHYHALRGTALLNVGRTREAKHCFSKALECAESNQDDTSLKTWALCGRAEARLEFDLELAKHDLDEAIRLEPNEDFHYFLRGLVEIKTENGKAAHYFSEAVRIFKAESVTHNPSRFDTQLSGFWEKVFSTEQTDDINFELVSNTARSREQLEVIHTMANRYAKLSDHPALQEIKRRVFQALLSHKPSRKKWKQGERNDYEATGMICGLQSIADYQNEKEVASYLLSLAQDDRRRFCILGVENPRVVYVQANFKFDSTDNYDTKLLVPLQRSEGRTELVRLIRSHGVKECWFEDQKIFKALSSDRILNCISHTFSTVADALSSK